MIFPADVKQQGYKDDNRLLMSCDRWQWWTTINPSSCQTTPTVNKQLFSTAMARATSQHQKHFKRFRFRAKKIFPRRDTTYLVNKLSIVERYFESASDCASCMFASDIKVTFQKYLQILCLVYQVWISFLFVS